MANDFTAGQTVRTAVPIGRLPAGEYVIVEAVTDDAVEITIPEIEGIAFWRVHPSMLQLAHRNNSRRHSSAKGASS